MLTPISSEHGPSFTCISVQRRVRSKRQECEGLSNQKGAITYITGAGYSLTVRSSSLSCGKPYLHAVEGSES